jgi:spore maturation protein CgeB
MNNKDLQQFIEAFDDFMKHFETEELYYEGRKVYGNHRAEARRIQEQEIEKEASRLEITVDYYLAEFM